MSGQNELKYIYLAETDEWIYVGEAIKRYLQYCHGIEGIEIIKYSNANFLKDNSWKSNNPNLNNVQIILLPLFERDEPSGLRLVKDLRTKERDYNFSPVFLVSTPEDIPWCYDQDRPMSNHAKAIIKNPDFGDIRKAIFLAEVRYDHKEGKFLNIVDLSDGNALTDLSRLLSNYPKVDFIKKYYEKYYDTFVNYYRPFQFSDLTINDKEFGIQIQEFLQKFPTKEECKNRLDESCTKLTEKLKDFGQIHAQEYLKLANRIYNCLNGLEETKSGHVVPLELFRAPVPFPLQELIDAKKEIEEVLGWENGNKGKTVKLFLIDNKTDKFRSENKSTICDVFEVFGISHLFEIEMVGVGKGEFEPQFERFDYEKFKNKVKLSELSQKERNYYQKVIDHYRFKNIETYTDLIYEKIKSSHFILLDFFLNEENTYLAFDFIKDISDMKKERGDYFTTWYFITSAVYDSVMKYSQSGLLAEYYESAVVNTGDDPINEKRQIILVYKLLTFIQARLRSFKYLQDGIIYKYLLSSGSCPYWPENSKNLKNDNCKKDICLEKTMLVNIRRYLHEFDDVKDIFYSKEDEQRERKNIVENLETLIKQFLWLPEADWQIIQHQIDYINAKLKSLGDRRQFSCNYITNEIQRRSEIY